ncbi:MAG: hypothetical protein M3350_00975 [Actinomycetota bacterium]|nr:hypothetical protein [Actinomycetota bacterium]
MDSAQSNPAKRGDAAWKEAKSRIAERNDKVRKDGKERREAYQREKQDRRRVADRLERAEVSAADEKRRKA